MPIFSSLIVRVIPFLSRSQLRYVLPLSGLFHLIAGMNWRHWSNLFKKFDILIERTQTYFHRILVSFFFHSIFLKKFLLV